MKNVFNSMALLRLSVLGSLASREHLNRGELKAIIKNLAQQTYHIPNRPTANLRALSRHFKKQPFFLIFLNLIAKLMPLKLLKI